MKKMSPNLVFNIDIHDYQSKKDVIITIINHKRKYRQFKK